jgi:hypothetical protein
MRVAVLTASVLLLFTSASTPPSEPWKIVHATVAAGSLERVAKHGRWEREGGVCTPKEIARLELIDTPRHGSIAFAREESRPGGCKLKLPHVTVYYTAASDYVGQDEFSYLRIDPESGEQRLVVVEVLVEPAATGALPAPVPISGELPRQIPRLPAQAGPDPSSLDRPAASPVWSCPAPCPLFEVVFTGDILLGDAGAKVFRTRGFAHAFAYLQPLLAGDYVVGNAEGPITERTRRPHREQRWSYAADPRTAATLREVGFSALGLANNHASDRGPEGLRDTLSHLERAGIEGFGAGADEVAALRPLWIETPFGRVAVVGMATPTLYAAEARSGEPGIAVVTPERIERVAKQARAARARWLVAFVHWGRNYRGVTAQQREVARLFADAGFDLVVGHHPHVVQQVQRIGKTWVLFSLGNLAFSTPGRFDDSGIPGYGLVARAYFGAEGLEAIELRCILTDNEVVAFQPRPCATREAASVLGGLGDGVTLRGDVGVLMREGAPIASRSPNKS